MTGGVWMIVGVDLWKKLEVVDCMCGFVKEASCDCCSS